MFEWPKTNDVLGTANRGNAAESGLCTLCRADCKGKCETWLSSIRGRKMLYPRDFGAVTAGANNTVHVGVSYNSLRIQGYLYGANGVSGNMTRDADDCIFPNVNIESSFGAEIKTKVRIPLMTGALGSTFIAAKYWDSFAIGCALAGMPIVVGENVVGIDRQSVLKNGRIETAPELDRRVDTYLKYYDGYGAIIVQMNIEDTRNGVAEYIYRKYGDKVILELKWGQGAKDIGGEIQVNDIDYAKFLKDRGYIVDPNPYLPEVEQAFKSGAIRSFARHSRLGYTNLDGWEQIREDFLNAVEGLRKLGFKRISLKTGSYGNEALAMAIKLATQAKLDLLTIDGSGGGTGMSPWNMMQSWGMPSIILHSKAHQYASVLASKGERVVDLSLAGGFAREDHIFKALALGAPFAKLICMGRAVMVPGFLGSNIEGALHAERREKCCGNWDALPPSVTEFGSKPEEIFAGYYDVLKKIGAAEMKNIPYGAIAIATLTDKLTCGLQQLMAGTRTFTLSGISRSHIASGNRETEAETKIPFFGDVQDEIAERILNS